MKAELYRVRRSALAATVTASPPWLMNGELIVAFAGKPVIAPSAPTLPLMMEPEPFALTVSPTIAKLCAAPTVWLMPGQKSKRPQRFPSLPAGHDTFD